LLCDASYRIVYANAFAMETLGRSAEDILGASFWTIIADGGDARKMKEPFLEDQQIRTFKCQFLTGSGFRMEADVDMIMVTDGFQDLHGFAVTGRLSGGTSDYLDRIKTCDQEIRQVVDEIEQRKALIGKHSVKLAEIRHKHAENISEFLKTDEMVLTDIDEREFLIGEVHNRVISNMQLMISIIGLYMSDHHPSAVTEKFKNLSHRVQTMLLLHQHLYFSMQYADVDFKAFLYQLVGERSATHDPSQNVNIHLQVSESFMDISKAIPLGLILNELIINSYTHAFVPMAGRQASDDHPLIEISLSGDSEGFSLIMKDNGRGLPHSYRHYAGAYGGLSLVDMLVRNQIEGDIRVDGDRGLEVYIDFSLAPKPD
jgi:two-component sensor histidine kinase